MYLSTVLLIKKLPVVTVVQFLGKCIEIIKHIL